MHRAWWICVAVVMTGCKGKGKAKEEPAATAPGSGAGSAEGSGSQTVVTPDAAAVAPPPSEPGCEGWRAAKVEHMGMGQISTSVDCKGGTITLTRITEGARDDEPETDTKKLELPAWKRLWQDLESAGWRTLVDPCPIVNPPPESFSVTDLDLEISDGTTTKKLTCPGPNVSAVHEQIMEALDTAAN